MCVLLFVMSITSAALLLLLLYGYLKFPSSISIVCRAMVSYYHRWHDVCVLETFAKFPIFKTNLYARHIYFRKEIQSIHPNISHLINAKSMYIYVSPTLTYWNLINYINVILILTKEIYGSPWHRGGGGGGSVLCHAAIPGKLPNTKEATIGMWGSDGRL